jgi:hypothetical protein
MEERSSQRIRTLMAHLARRGMHTYEIVRARISMMVRSTRAPIRGLIHWCKPKNPLDEFLLRRAAGPYIPQTDVDGAPRESQFCGS